MKAHRRGDADNFARDIAFFVVAGIDPRIYLEVGAVLLSATFLACWIPARRASRVDPIVALRTE